MSNLRSVNREEDDAAGDQSSGFWIGIYEIFLIYVLIPLAYPFIVVVQALKRFAAGAIKFSRRNRTGVLAFILGVLGLIGLFSTLALANVAPFGAYPNWWPFTVKPLADISTYGAVVAAAVTCIGGSVALITFILSHDQKERHHRDQEKLSRDQSEMQRLQDQFVVLVENLEIKSTIAQLNAITGLGDMSQQIDPGRVSHDGVVSSQRGRIVTYQDFEAQEFQFRWPDEWTSKKAEVNYPYFLRTARRLATALHYWGDETIRLQIISVFERMARFASDDDGADTDQPLLHSLANILADANRLSRIGLIESLAIALDQGVDTRFLGNKLFDEMIGESTSMNRNARQLIRVSYVNDLIEDSKSLNAKVLARKQVGIAAENALYDRLMGFIGTQKALSLVLRQFGEPPEVNWASRKKVSIEEYPNRWKGRGKVQLRKARNHDFDDVEYRHEPDRLRSRRKLNLDGVHLVNMDLSWANLQGASLREADLTGSNLMGARLDIADCTSAIFFGCSCESAQFFASDCTESNMSLGSFIDAQFEAASLKGVFMLDANCSEARFVESDMEGAKIGTCDFGQNSGQPAIFKYQEWKFADFSEYRLNRSARVVLQGSCNEPLKIYLAGLIAVQN